MTDVKENTTEIVQDKGKNKVETKSSTPKRKASLTKECDVLVYNERTNTAIISFDGFGYELTGISKILVIKFLLNIQEIFILRILKLRRNNV